jgi:hypothetical protein
MVDMTDEQFRALRQLILDQGVKLEELSLTVRTLQRRIEELAAQETVPIEMASNPTIYEGDELSQLIRTRQSRARHTDKE